MQLNMCVGEKDTSLLVWSISDKENIFYNTDSAVNIIDFFVLSLMKMQNKLEYLPLKRISV